MRDKSGYGAILDRWLPEVRRVVNDRGTDHAIRERLETALQSVIDRRFDGETVPLALPGTTVSVRRGRVVIEPDHPPLPITVSGEHAADYMKLLLAVIYASAVMPIGRRWRRCDWRECRAFFIAKADHRRKHSFCCDYHRRQFDLTTRDPREMAAYMRRYRKVMKQRRQRKGATTRQTREKGTRS